MKTERLYLKNYFAELGENGCDAYVDCYIPTPIHESGKVLEDKKYPCMVICPGGGYGMVSEREGEPIALHFLSDGYRVIVVHYSIAPHSFPQQLREVAGAMELIYQNADEWKIDVSKVAIVGFSAGGHLAAQYSNRYDCPEIREIFPESKPVQASILSYAVLIADPKYTHGGTVFNFVGGHVPADMQEKGCSCELLVSDKTPPTFLWHTAEDQVVPVENTLFYAKALSDHKIPFEIHIYPYGPHGLATADGVTYAQIEDKHKRAHKWFADVKTWLEFYF